MPGKVVQNILDSAEASVFLEDVALLEKVPAHVVREAVEILLGYGSVVSSAGTQALTALAQRTKVPYEHILHALRLGLTLIQQCSATGDTVETVVHDLEQMGHAKTPNDLREKLRLFGEPSDNPLLRLLRQQQVISQILPVITGFQTRNILAYSVEPGFNTAQDKPETYQPRAADVLPVIVVTVQLDAFGQRQVFHAGLSPAQAADFIAHLRLALAEAERLPKPNIGAK